MTNISRINATFTNLRSTDEGEFITAASIVTMSTIDADDTYAVTGTWTVADLSPEAAEVFNHPSVVAGTNGYAYSNACDLLMEDVSVAAGELAESHGLKVVGTDGTDQVFYSVAAA